MEEKDVIEAQTVEDAAAPGSKQPDVLVAPMEHVQDYQDAEHVNLSWRSWMVVFVTCFAIMAQVFVVVAAGSVIAFIIRDLGDASLAGWVIRKTSLPTANQPLTSHQRAPS